MVVDKPLRVLVIISNKNPYWAQSWSDSEEILPATYQILKESNLMQGPISHQPELRLLAKQR
jgi:hypothetical protein